MMFCKRIRYDLCRNIYTRKTSLKYWAGRKTKLRSTWWAAWLSQSLPIRSPKAEAIMASGPRSPFSLLKLWTLGLVSWTLGPWVMTLLGPPESSSCVRPKLLKTYIHILKSFPISPSTPILQNLLNNQNPQAPRMA